MSAITATLPAPHPSLANTVRLSVCVCVWRRKRRRIRIEEEERTLEATVQVPHPSFSETKLQRQRKGRGERRRRDVFSEWFFASFSFSSCNQWSKTVPALFQQHGQEFLSFFDSPSSTNIHPLFCSTLYSILPLAGLQTDGGGKERGEGRREGGKTRQDRAFSLEIITFTLLMYGQTTKDIHRQ